MNGTLCWGCGWTGSDGTIHLCAKCRHPTRWLDGLEEGPCEMRVQCACPNKDCGTSGCDRLFIHEAFHSDCIATDASGDGGFLGWLGVWLSCDGEDGLSRGGDHDDPYNQCVMDLLFCAHEGAGDPWCAQRAEECANLPGKEY